MGKVSLWSPNSRLGADFFQSIVYGYSYQGGIFWDHSGGKLISEGVQKLAACSLLKYCKEKKKSLASVRGPWAHVELVKSSRKDSGGNVTFVS